MRDDPTNLYGDRCVRKATTGKTFCHHHYSPKHGVWNGAYDGPLLRAIEKLNGGVEREQCYARMFNASEHLDKNKKPVVMEGRDEKNLYGGRCNRNAKDGKFCGVHKKNHSHGVWNGDYEGKLREAIHKMKVEERRKKMAHEPIPEESHFDITEEHEEEHNEEEYESDGSLDVYPINIDGKTYYMPKKGIDVYDIDGESIGTYDRELGEWIEMYNRDDE
jgi:hypothetical protein